MKKTAVFSEDEIEETTERLAEGWTNSPGSRRRTGTVPQTARPDLEALIGEIMWAYNSGRSPYAEIDEAKQKFIRHVTTCSNVGQSTARIIADGVADEIQEMARGR